MRKYDRTHEKSGTESKLMPRERVYFPRLGDRSTRYRPKIFLKTNHRLDADIKRLATRFGTIDEQWLIRTVIHMMATVPLHEFNTVYKSYLEIQRRREIEKVQERRSKYPVGATARIMQAGGIDWLIWSKSQGRTMKKTAERIDVPPSAIHHFLQSRYNTNWTKLGE